MASPFSTSKSSPRPATRRDRQTWWLPAISLGAAGVVAASAPRSTDAARQVFPSLEKPPATSTLRHPATPADQAVLLAHVRSFDRFDRPGSGHPDFQQYASGHRLGLVGATLDARGKPRFQDQRGVIPRTGRPGPTNALHSAESLANWFSGPASMLELPVRPASFDGSMAVSPAESDLSAIGPYFTLELPTAALYRRGTGQWLAIHAVDDAWVFIGGVLAIDLGGTHGLLDGRIDLDQLADATGFRDGQRLPIRVFSATRRAGRSGFGLRTNLALEPEQLPHSAR